jgi:hypothetical protein
VRVNLNSTGAALMIVDRYDPINLFEMVPKLKLEMEPELAQLDRLLDDDELFCVVKADLMKRYPNSGRLGRHSTPVEVILRMLWWSKGSTDGISMKMSSRRSGLEGGPVPQHRPQDVDPSAGEGDQRLSVLLALGSLAIVESSGFWGAAHAGEGRLVEDPLEKLVSPAHPVVVSLPLAGVVGRRDQSRA